MKGRRKQVGKFKIGDNVIDGSIVGEIESFPSRRIAVLKVKSDEGFERVEVSTLDLKMQDNWQ
jgi:hypothetical protein